MRFETTAGHGRSFPRAAALQQFGLRPRREGDGGPRDPSPIRRCPIEFVGDWADDHIGTMQKEVA
jgi:hypothetical protein